MDNKNLEYVKRIAEISCLRYDLGGYIILLSSTTTQKIENADYSEAVYRYRTGNFHIVFNRKVSPLELHSMLAWLCMRLKDENLTKWFHMQCVKQTVTLRIGFKGRKKPPRIVYRYGNHDKQIAKFLANREFILDFARK